MLKRTIVTSSLFLSLFFVGLTTTSCKDKAAEKEKELKELRQLAEMDRKEMESQYSDLANQYQEMKVTIKDDSLVHRLSIEQERAERLLAELKSVKSSSSSEILRLKKELATVRAVLRDYIRQVDSLQQKNIRLTNERDAARAEVEQSHRENLMLSNNNAQLKQTVEVASQLNATNISLVPIKKNGKPAKKAKDAKNVVITFTIARNVTAKVGNRTIYVRVLKPNQSVLNESGNFNYENKSIAYSASKNIEYSGEEQSVKVFVPINEFIDGGNYVGFIFCDGQMIGSGTMSIK